MRILTGLALLTLVMFVPSKVLAAEGGMTDCEQFLADSGLAEMHASYAKFFTLLSEGKAVEANELLAKTMPSNAPRETQDRVLRATAALATLFDKGVEDAELITAQKISAKSVVLYYVLNTSGGPILAILMPFQRAAHWQTHTWMMEANVPKIIETLKGIERFHTPAVISFKPRGMTT